MNDNFAGHDISPDMARLARVNMYLHEFKNPKISEYDTLTSKEKWDESFDVIIANHPFMTPKSGIVSHNRYMISAKKVEVLFVDYIAEHLNPAARAGIIVPEHIMFQSSNSYKSLHKYLVEDNCLYAVISLPEGVFIPYSAVKTSILLFDKTPAKQRNDILFVKISNYGYSLGEQRREIECSEVNEVIKIVKAHQQGEYVSKNSLATMATKLEISEQDYILVGDRYKVDNEVNIDDPSVELREIESYQNIIYGAKQIVDNYRTMIQINPKWEVVKLGNVCILNPPQFETKDLDNNDMDSFVDIRKNNMLFKSNKEILLSEAYYGYSFFKDYDVILDKFKFWNSALVKELKNGIGFGPNKLIVFRAKECILPEILHCYINSNKFIYNGKLKHNRCGMGKFQKITNDFIMNYSIALPTIDEQHKIVSIINEEIAIVEENKWLIEIYEQKINDKIKNILGK